MLLRVVQNLLYAIALFKGGAEDQSLILGNSTIKIMLVFCRL